jgi:copper(I)-binding protein
VTIRRPVSPAGWRIVTTSRRRDTLWDVRRLTRVAGIVAAALLAAGAGAGCSSKASGPGSIAATAAYIQLPTGKTTVGYLDIRNNGVAADQLVSVSTSVGGTVELRAPASADVTPVVMRTVSSIDIPAGTMVQLVPNSYHLLITGAGPMQDGKDITLRLKFAHAGTVTVLALVTNPATNGGGYFGFS